MDGFQKATELQPIVERLNENATEMNTDIQSITDDVNVLQTVSNMKEVVGDCLNGLTGIIEKVTAFSNNLIDCWKNKQFVMGTLGVNANFVKVVMESTLYSTIVNLIIDSDQFKLYNPNFGTVSNEQHKGHTVIIRAARTGFQSTSWNQIIHEYSSPYFKLSYENVTEYDLNNINELLYDFESKITVTGSSVTVSDNSFDCSLLDLTIG